MFRRCRGVRGRDRSALDFIRMSWETLALPLGRNGDENPKEISHALA